MPMAISTMFHLNILSISWGRPNDDLGHHQPPPPLINIVGEGEGGGLVLHFLSVFRCMHGRESCALAIVMLQRADGRRRRREEGFAVNNGGSPGSFNDKCEVDTFLHHLGY